MVARVAFLCACFLISTILTIGGISVICAQKKSQHAHDTAVTPIVLIVIVFSWLATLLFGYGLTLYVDLMNQRQVGLDYENAGDYIAAYNVYLDIYDERGNWNDIVECIGRVEKPARYSQATEFYKNQQYLEALEIFLSLGDYGNSSAMADKCMRAYSETP
ncbi:MAG: hypothetical protein NC548_05930 [Lachnospiraceae bacterium]|nr:hypothetical protein [Lachnospiraceae bacterium]